MMSTRLFIIGISILIIFSTANADLVPVWESNHDGAYGPQENKPIIVRDSENNIILSGSIETPGNGQDILVVKYSPSGSMLWEQTFDGANDTDLGLRVVVDSDDNIVITGITTLGSNQFDYIILKYSTGGNLLWSRNFNGPLSDFDVPHDLEISQDNEIIITGEMTDFWNGVELRMAVATLKYSSSGDLIWSHIYDSDVESYDVGVNVEPDSFGNTYVLVDAFSFDGQGGGTSSMVLLKYDSFGTILWEKAETSLKSNADSPYTTERNVLKVDSNGDIIFVANPVSSSSLVISKYQQDGVRLWQAEDIVMVPNDICEDQLGNYLITGYRGENYPTLDLLVCKYTSSGLLEWEYVFDGPANDFDEGVKVYTDSNGNISVIGFGKGLTGSIDLIKLTFSIDGNLLSEDRTPGEQPSRFIDAYYDFVYDEGKQIVWAKSLNDPDRLYNLRGFVSTVPELSQYDQVSDRLSNLKLDVYAPLDFPAPGFYMNGADNFVNNWIRPGNPTALEEESFSRLLMALKLVNAGYRYVPIESDYLPEPHYVRGAEEMWDLGSKNTVKAIMAASGIIHLLDKIAKDLFGETTYKWAMSKITNFLMNVLIQIKHLIPDQETKNFIDFVWPTFKATVLTKLDESACFSCIATEPAVRAAGTLVAIESFHVPRTQGAVDQSTQWASSGIFSGGSTEASSYFLNRMQVMEQLTASTASTVENYESQSGVENTWDEMQDLLNSPFSGSIWTTIKELKDVVLSIINPTSVKFSVKAAAEAFSTAGIMPEQINLGVSQVYGTPFPSNSSLQGHLEYSNDQDKGTTTESNVRLQYPSEILHYQNKANEMVGAFQLNDSIGIIVAAESLSVVAYQVDSLFKNVSTFIQSKVDSATILLPDYEQLISTFDSLNNITDAIILDNYLLCLVAKNSPFEQGLSTSALSVLNLYWFTLMECWEEMAIISNEFSSVPGSAVLHISNSGDQVVVERGQLVSIQSFVKNVGNQIATDSYLRIIVPETILLQGDDSLYFGSITPGDSVSLSIPIILDSVINSATYYKSHFLDLLPYGESTSGVGGSVILTARATYCGDVNNDRSLDIGDLTSLIDWMFRNGSYPIPMEGADINCDKSYNITDLTFFVSYLFKNGDSPCCP